MHTTYEAEPSVPYKEMPFIWRRRFHYTHILSSSSPSTIYMYTSSSGSDGTILTNYSLSQSLLQREPLSLLQLGLQPPRLHLQRNQHHSYFTSNTPKKYIVDLRSLVGKPVYISL